MIRNFFLILLVTAMAGCGGPGFFREQSAAFVAETGSARYYSAHGTWSNRPNVSTVTLKRVDKLLGFVSYGDQASVSLDRENP